MWHLKFNQKFEALEIGANDTEFPWESFQKIWTLKQAWFSKNTGFSRKKIKQKAVFFFHKFWERKLRSSLEISKSSKQNCHGIENSPIHVSGTDFWSESFLKAFSYQKKRLLLLHCLGKDERVLDKNWDSCIYRFPELQCISIEVFWIGGAGLL